MAVSACLRVSCAVGEGTLGTRVGNEETGSVTQTSNAVAREEGWAWSAAGSRSPVGFEQRVFHGARAELLIGGCRPEALQPWGGPASC